MAKIIKIPHIKEKVKSNPVFIPFNYESHKQNKINFMKIELSLLNCLRIIENLHKLKKTKYELKKELQSAINANLMDFKRIQNELPVVKTEKNIKKAKEIKTNVNLDEFQESEFKQTEKQEPFNKELEVIQARLKKLSNYQ